MSFGSTSATMGYGEDWWNGDIKKHMDWRMEPLGMTYEELRSQLSQRANIRSRCRLLSSNMSKRFSAKSTRIDKWPYLPEGKVALYNTLFEKAGLTPMPVWREFLKVPLRHRSC